MGNHPDVFDEKQVIEYWFIEAEEALRVANNLIDKKDYSYALFFGHLATEKILKALYAKRRHTHAPPIHNLHRLAKEVELELSEFQKNALIDISNFNLETRYPDIKRLFRKKCTAEYTGKQMQIIRELFQWFKSQLL